MILKNGKNFGFQKDQQLHVPSLNWYATSTPNIIHTNTMSPVPVHLKQSING